MPEMATPSDGSSSSQPTPSKSLIIKFKMRGSLPPTPANEHPPDLSAPVRQKRKHKEKSQPSGSAPISTKASITRIDPDALTPAAPRKRHALDDSADKQKTKKVRLVLILKRFELQWLPGDVLHILANEHLESHDFLNLRLTSRHLKEQTEKAFGRRYFKTRKIMLSPYSINALLAMSKHAQLAQFIRHITIGLERLQYNYHDAFRPCQISALREWKEKYHEKYHFRLVEQELMERYNTDARILAQVFASLPNLESVGVCGGSLISPTKDLRRLEDEDSMQSWGAEHLIRELGAGDEPNGSFTRLRVANRAQPPVNPGALNHPLPSIALHILWTAEQQTPTRMRLLSDTTKEYRPFGVLFRALREAGRELKVDLVIPRLQKRYSKPFDLEEGDVYYGLPMVRSLKFEGGLGLSQGWSEGWVEQLFRETAPTSVYIRDMLGRLRGSDSAVLRMLPVGFNTPLKALRIYNMWELEAELLKAMLVQLAPSLETLDLAHVTIAVNRDPGRRLRQWVDVFEIVRGMPALTSLSLADLDEYCDEVLVLDDPRDKATKKKERNAWIFRVHVRGRERIARVLNPDAWETPRRGGPVESGRVRWRKALIGSCGAQ